jgi:hypothetical protein
MDMTKPPEDMGDRLIIRRAARFGLREILELGEHSSEMFIRTSQNRGRNSRRPLAWTDEAGA